VLLSLVCLINGFVASHKILSNIFADNALVTQSRLILLDSPLIFFTALTALSFSCFTNQQELGPTHAFGGPWWFWLVFTGLSLGATLSVKWVGLFTMAWVGSLTALQLWVLLGDSKTVTPVRILNRDGLTIRANF
jgi:dolichyl-phosphate-mannose-protein mannosyltransferase